MKLNRIPELLVEKYKKLYSKNGHPKSMFNMSPAIPFVGLNYQDTMPKVLSYASAENLCYAFDENFRPKPDEDINELNEDEQFNRARFFYNQHKGKQENYFPYVHMEPFNNGSQLLITRHILNRMGHNDKFESDPYGFIEQISVANAGKFSIESDANKDYASDHSYMKLSIDYIKIDFAHLKPTIVVIPKTIFNTIDKIEKWNEILCKAGIDSVTFILIYQLSFHNDNRIKKAIEGKHIPRMVDYPYGEWLKLCSKTKFDVSSYLAWIHNDLHEVTHVESG